MAWHRYTCGEEKCFGSFTMLYISPGNVVKFFFFSYPTSVQIYVEGVGDVRDLKDIIEGWFILLILPFEKILSEKNEERIQ